MLTRLLLLAAAVLFTAAGWGGDDAARLTDAQLANATYRGGVAPGGSLTLVDGRLEVSPPSGIGRVNATLIDARGFGRLHEDGAPDAAVVIATNTGGSGTFFELFAVLNRQGKSAPSPPVALGDRVPVQSIEIADRQITVRLRSHAPNDPLCSRIRE